MSTPAVARASASRFGLTVLCRNCWLFFLTAPSRANVASWHFSAVYTSTHDSITLEADEWGQGRLHFVTRSLASSVNLRDRSPVIRCRWPGAGHPPLAAPERCCSSAPVCLNSTTCHLGDSPRRRYHVDFRRCGNGVGAQPEFWRTAFRVRSHTKRSGGPLLALRVNFF